jgi:hypothetical protein
MKIKKALLLLVSIFLSCSNSSTEQEKVITLKLSYRDSQEIGLPESSNHEIGPNRLRIYGEDILFIDQYFSRIVKVNLSTNIVHKSFSFSQKLNKDYSFSPHIWDVIQFQNKIYVCSRLDSIFVFDKDLNYINSIKVGDAEEKYFFKNDRNSFILYLENKDKVFTIDSNQNLEQFEIKDRRLISEVHSTYLGDKYNVDSLQVKTKYGIILLNEPIQNITLHQYQCENIAFDSLRFSHFSIDREKMEMKIYLYEW